MKFRKYGKANPIALEIENEIEIMTHVKHAGLRRLSFLLGVVKKAYPNKEADFINLIGELYASHSSTELSKTYNMDDMISEFSNLKDNQKLALNLVKFILECLGVNPTEELKQEKVKIKQRDFFRSFLIPRYNNLEILTKILPREDAISLYKRYISDYLATFSSVKDNQVENLKEFEKKYFVSKNADEPGGFYGLCSSTYGKFFYRKDNCLWVDAIQECSDTEIRHYICCYGDFHSIKEENKNFVLTMKHTIAKGDQYCDCITHDTRIDWDLTHPEADFWDAIKPMKK